MSSSEQLVLNTLFYMSANTTSDIGAIVLVSRGGANMGRIPICERLSFNHSLSSGQACIKLRLAEYMFKRIGPVA